MKTTTLFLISGLVAATAASKNAQLDIVWSAPKVTEAVELKQLPPPPSAPTDPPVLKIRDSPAVFKRQDSSPTCGLYSNGVPYECGVSETCGSTGDNFGCCVGQACSFSTACLDSTAEACSAGTEGLQTLCCNFSSDQPSCVTIVSTTDGNSYTDFRCGNIQYASEIQTITALDALETEDPTDTEVNTTETEDTPGGDYTGTTTGDDSSSTETGGSNNDNNDDSNSDSGGGSSNTGAIVGGVVGGVAVLGLIGLGFWFLRKKMNKPKPAPGGDPNTAYQAVPPGHPHPDMSQPYAGTPSQFTSTPSQYQPGYSPYPSNVSAAGYPPTEGPSPHMAHAGAIPAQGYFAPGQSPDQFKGAPPPQGTAVEIDSRENKPVELA